MSAAAGQGGDIDNKSAAKLYHLWDDCLNEIDGAEKVGFKDSLDFFGVYVQEAPAHLYSRIIYKDVNGCIFGGDSFDHILSGNIELVYGCGRTGSIEGAVKSVGFIEVSHCCDYVAACLGGLDSSQKTKAARTSGDKYTFWPAFVSHFNNSFLFCQLDNKNINKYAQVKHNNCF